MENKDRKDFISISIESFFVTIITLFLQYIFLFVSASVGSVTISNSIQNKEAYTSIISIKNYQSDSYLENIAIDISKEVKITSIEKVEHNYEIENNKIIIDKIRPDDVVNILIYSDSRLDEDNTKIISDNQKIEMINLDTTGSLQKSITASVVLNAVVMFITYAVVLYFMKRFLLSKMNKVYEENEKLKEKCNKVIEEKEEKIAVYNDYRNKNLELINEKAELSKKIDEMELDFLTRLKDLSSEIDFYKKNLIYDSNKNNTFNSSNLKLDSRKNVKNDTKTSKNTIEYFTEKLEKKHKNDK